MSYTAATKAGKIKVDVVNWENPAGGGMDISVGDVIADLGDIDVNTAATAASLASVTVVDDAAFTPGTTSVQMAGFEFDDVTPDSVDEGDGGAARMSANRNIYTTLRDAAGNERGANIDASNQLAVADSAAATLLGTIDADTSTIAGDTTSLDAKAPALGTAAMAASSPFTLATDDTQFGAVGAAADPDGNIHGQLRSIAEGVVAAPVAATRTVTNATGAGAIATTTAVSADWKLNHVSIHFGAAITAAESVTVSLDANDGAAYDIPFDIMLLTGETDYFWYPEKDLVLESGDEVAVAFAGTDGETFGLRIVGEKV